MSNPRELILSRWAVTPGSGDGALPDLAVTVNIIELLWPEGGVSYDVYATNADELTCLTDDESFDRVPEEADIVEVIERAQEAGLIAGRWSASYTVRSSNAPASTVMGSGTAVVIAESEADARAKLLDWVHDNDPRADVRIDPYVELDDVEVAPFGEGGVTMTAVGI